MARPLETWKLLTTRGNALFDAGKNTQALDAYERARSLALAHFHLWPEPADAVAAVVVSFLNLSNAQARDGQIALASDSLCTLHGSLLKTAQAAEAPEPLRLAARRRLRETFAALVRFQAAHGPRPEITQWLHGGCRCAACGHPGEFVGDEPSPTLH